MPANERERVEEFRSLSLAIQHRRLLAQLAEFETEVREARERAASPWSPPCSEWKTMLTVLLQRFVLQLDVHFETESRTTAELFRAVDQRERLEKFRVIEAEHPGLLARFRTLLARIEAPQPDRDDILRNLVEAIAAFRDHEAREHSLFTAA